MSNRLMTAVTISLLMLGPAINVIHAQVAKQETAAEPATPVAIDAGVVTLSPENTRIEFVGTHVGDDPRPRLGGFEKFTGQIHLGDNDVIESIKVEFDVTSIWTTIPKLTGHLKTADFFDVGKFPKASFKSTRINYEQGRTKITGDLSLLGNTRPISFTAKVSVSNAGFLLFSEFEMDRTHWGMTKMTDGVNAEVTVQVAVGRKTEPHTGD